MIRIIRYLFWHYLALFELRLMRVFKKDGGKYLAKSLMHQAKGLFILGDQKLITQFIEEITKFERDFKEGKYDYKIL